MYKKCVSEKFLLNLANCKNQFLISIVDPTLYVKSFENTSIIKCVSYHSPDEININVLNMPIKSDIN